MIVFVDMYCGCGGMSTGFHEACQELRLPYREIAINHWLRAIETMRANHPDVLALKMDIEAATSKDIGVKVIDLLHASPSCTHHSRAKGGKPCDDQLRSQPNEIWKKDYVGCELDPTFYKAAYSRIYDNPTPQPTEEFLPLMP